MPLCLYVWVCYGMYVCNVLTYVCMYVCMIRVCVYTYKYSCWWFLSGEPLRAVFRLRNVQVCGLKVRGFRAEAFLMSVMLSFARCRSSKSRVIYWAICRPDHGLRVFSRARPLLLLNPFAAFEGCICRVWSRALHGSLRRIGFSEVFASVWCGACFCISSLHRRRACTGPGGSWWTCHEAESSSESGQSFK